MVYAYLLDGTFVNAELIKDGWAVTMTIPPNVRHADDFITWQREARDQGRGDMVPIVNSILDSIHTKHLK